MLQNEINTDRKHTHRMRYNLHSGVGSLVSSPKGPSLRLRERTGKQALPRGKKELACTFLGFSYGPVQGLAHLKTRHHLSSMLGSHRILKGPDIRHSSCLSSPCLIHFTKFLCFMYLLKGLLSAPQ